MKRTRDKRGPAGAIPPSDVQAEAPLYIYNLFPRLAGDMRRWPAHARRARDMGFDWLLLNPIHYPGFSGSCYAVKDDERVDPVLLPGGHPDKHYEEAIRADGGMELLAATLQEIRALGMRPMLDLVLNHTSRDARLVQAHPEWYVRDAQGNVQSPSAIDPADARRVTVWGDLAELDHAGSPDAEGLRAHWCARVERWLDLGFEGFRCDAAYKVPAASWSSLLAAARRRNPDVLFLAETLGARLEAVRALRDSGLPYHFNSSKYWNFTDAWCLKQQRDHAAFLRSVSFPESHDTPRLWAETGGRAAVQRQRYAFAAAFAGGVLLPVGYEYGFQRRLHVVETRPEHWEAPAVDLTTFIARVNDICRRTPAFCTESVEALTALDGPTLLLERRASGSNAFIAVNKDWESPQNLVLPAAARGRQVLRVCRDGASADESSGATLDLDPAGVAYIL